MTAQLTDALDLISASLIRRLVALNPDIGEGVVRTVGPPPYRRLDCRKRALVYIRARPKKRLVRVDLTGLWLAPPRCRLSLPSAAGAALALRSELDVEDAIRFILQAVARTQLSLPRARAGRQCDRSPIAS